MDGEKNYSSVTRPEVRVLNYEGKVVKILAFLPRKYDW